MSELDFHELILHGNGAINLQIFSDFLMMEKYFKILTIIKI